jgi:hypothetical protein
MNKISTAILFLLFSLQALAQEMNCLDKLLPFNRHSGLHTLMKDEWYNGKDALDSEGANAALSFLINSKLLCKTADVVVKMQPTCQQVLADVPQSNVCFVYTNVGYFVISRDNVRNTNFIFSKDKRYSEPAE